MKRKTNSPFIDRALYWFWLTVVFVKIKLVYTSPFFHYFAMIWSSYSFSAWKKYKFFLSCGRLFVTLQKRCADDLFMSSSPFHTSPFSGYSSIQTVTVNNTEYVLQENRCQLRGGKAKPVHGGGSPRRLLRRVSRCWWTRTPVPSACQSPSCHRRWDATWPNGKSNSFFCETILNMIEYDQVRIWI